MLPDLRILIESESVLNDGAAIVVFELCKSILVASSKSGENAHVHSGVGPYIAEGCQLVFAAPALGAAFYIGTEFWLSHTEDPIQVRLHTVFK